MLKYENGTTSDTLVSIHELQSASILVTSGAALLAYDFFLLLPEEIEYVWKQRWSVVSALFILARYAPIIDTSLFLIRQYSPYPSARICMLSWNVVVWCYLCSLSIVEIILIIRTYAIWEHNRVVLVLLLLMAVLSFGAAVFFSQEYLRSLMFEPNPFKPNVLPGCYTRQVNNIAYACYAILLAHETVIFILTLTRAIYQRGFGKSFIATVVFRDGLLYFAFILISTIATIILMIHAPGTLATSSTPLHRTLHTILAQRLVLNIRKAAASSSSRISTDTLHTYLHGTYVPSHIRRGSRDTRDSRERMEWEREAGFRMELASFDAEAFDRVAVEEPEEPEEPEEREERELEEPPASADLLLSPERQRIHGYRSAGIGVAL